VGLNVRRCLHVNSVLVIPGRASSREPGIQGEVLIGNRTRSQASTLTKVTLLEKLGGFRLRVRFNDGSEGVHDFATMVREPGAALEPLRNEGYFARVFLEFGAPAWPNGFDIAPEWLRREMEAAGELTRVAAVSIAEGNSLDPTTRPTR
jgi:hypothetical protein